jgi:recA bacterial DNA recombination protein
MGTSGKIVDLRALLAERFPCAPLAPAKLLPTGVASLDLIVGGGLPKGAVTELISPALSAGSASLIAELIQSAQQDRYFTALIDGCNSFDPEPLGNSCLRHLLWIRCRTAVESVKAADFLLRDGNFPLVMIDLVLNPAKEVRKIPQTSWYRLQRLVEPTCTAFLVFTRWSVVSSAQLKIVLENQWTLQNLEKATSQIGIQVRRSHVAQAAIGNIG